MTVTYLDPSADPVTSDGKMSDRPESLEGLTIGLLDNGKTNSDNLLEFISNQLSDTYPNINFEWLSKPSPFKPAPDELIQDVSVKYGAVITGIGD